MNFVDLQNFLIAIAIGGLIGLEREIGQRSKDRSSFAGFRTFILISFFGAVSYFLGDKLNLQYLPGIAFGLFSILIIVTYYVSAKEGFVGITSELTSLITFLLGILVMQSEYQQYAVVFAVLITILLAFKKHVHQLLEKAKIEEWYDTLKFAFIAFVVLPLLPNQGFGPFEFFNPYQTWLMVVFVSGISFLGYFAVKIFGARLGINFSGFLGGLVSSTAVTNTMATNSKKVKGKNVLPFVTGAILACSIMFIRILVEIFAIDFLLTEKMIIPFAIMLVIGLVPVTIWWEKSKKAKDIELELKSPFSLPPAIQFAALFVVVQFVTKLLVNSEIGDAGFIVAGILAGITDVDAITLSMSQLFKDGVVSAFVASTSIVAAALTNTAVKAGISWIWGSNAFRKRVVGILGLMILVGVIATVLV